MKHPYVIIIVFGAAIFSSVLTSIIISFNSARSSPLDRILPRTVDFSEFTGLLLACIAIIITLFGVFLAVLAVYGFSAIQEKVAATAEEAARKSVETSLKEDGELYRLTRKTVQEITYRGVGLDESSGALDPKEANGEYNV